MKPTIRKLNGDWNACYIDKNGVVNYISHAKTKDELILRLIECWLHCNGYKIQTGGDEHGRIKLKPIIRN